MEPIQAFFTGLGLLLAATAAALFLVRRPLDAILLELCGAPHRARFWNRLYGVSLFLLVGQFALWVPPSRSGENADFMDLLGTFRAGAFALLFGLGFLAAFMLIAIANHDRARREVARSRIGE